MENKDVSILFYAMAAFAKSIYLNLKTLCELEKDGKKDESAYYNTLADLKRLMESENNLYKNNIDIINANRGEFVYYATKNLSKQDKDKFDLLSEFDELSIYERIKSKLKYFVGLNKSFNRDLLSNLKVNYYDEKTTSESFLDESFINDMQKMSIYYMEHDHLDDKRAIDYKYLSALLFNVDIELANNYFEMNRNIYLNSPLIYGLSGLYKEIYIIDLTEVLLTKFNEFIDYIIMKSEDKDEDSKYKIEIALSYLESILDLLPTDIKEELYNNVIMEICDDGAVTLPVKLQIVNSMRNASRGRVLLKEINLKINENWID